MELTIPQTPVAEQQEPQPYTPTEAETKRIKRVGERVNWRGRVTSRWALERGWYENILMIQGHQWLDYSAANRTFKPSPTPGWFPRVTQNELAPRARRLEANLLKRRPAARVRPGSSEPADRQAARNAEHLLAHIDDNVREDELRQRAAVIVVPCGTVISKEWWNAQAGPEVAYQETESVPIHAKQPVAQCPACGDATTPEMTGQMCVNCGQAPYEAGEQPLTNEDGSPQIAGFENQPKLDEFQQPVMRRMRIGEIESDMLLPFAFYIDEQAPTLRRAEWCCELSWRSLEWIKRTFPEKGEFVRATNNVEVSTFYETQLLHLVGQGADRYARSEGVSMQAPNREGALFYWYEERPSADHPEGLLVIMAGDVELHSGPLPISPDEFSFSEFQYWIVPGRFFGETPITPCVPLQRRINSKLSQLSLNDKTMLNPMIIAPQGCGIKWDQVLWRPGGHIEYTFVAMGTAPQVLPGTPLPQQVLDVIGLTMESMNRIAATEEVTGGDMAAASKSGIALAQLNEAGETTHTPLMQRWEQFVADRGRKRLLLAEKYYSEKRKVKVLGSGYAWSVKYLEGADIRGNTDVVVEAGSSLPRSRQAVLQAVMDLIQAQILNAADPRVRTKVLEEFGLQGLEAELDPDQQMALEENAMMDMGQAPEVTPYEDRQKHLQIHLAEMKDPRFYQKPPEAQRAYEQHVQQTRMIELEALKMEMAAAQQGGEPGQEPGAEPGGGEAVDQPPQGAENAGEPAPGV